MEALANLSQFGICELRENELMLIDGGSVWDIVGASATIVAGVATVVAVKATPVSRTVSLGAAIVAGAATAVAGVCWLGDTLWGD
jgi:hypothetical protein